MKKLFFLAATVCTFFACSKEEITPTPDERIPINISVGQETRANDDTFEADDEVGVYVVNYTDDVAGTLALTGNQADNMRFTFSDNAWVPDDAIYWKDKSTPADFFVYYPYVEDLSSVTAHPFSVQTDQSTAANFWASDFLWGKATKVSPTFSAIPITTNHSLSRIILNLQPGVGYPTDDWASAEKTVTITNVKTSATIDLSTGVATATGTATNVTPLKVSESNNTIRYQAMMIPQEITTASTLIKVTIDGEEYSITKSITLKPRTQHVFTLKVNEETGSIDLTIGEWLTEDVFQTNSDCPNNQIWYTSTTGAKVVPDTDNVFGASIKSNVYSDGLGIITFDGDVTSIGKEAFYNCDNLESIVIPNSVTVIGEKAFYDCGDLKVEFGNSVETIANEAFNKTYIVNGNLPNSLKTIGDNAFGGIFIRGEAETIFINLVIPDGVTSIGDSAFGAQFESITLPESIEHIGEEAFKAKAFYGKYASADNLCLIEDGVLRYFTCTYREDSYTIPNGVTEIGKNVFKSNDYNRGNITQITIPSSVKKIGEDAFYGLSNIKTFTIPEGVEEIGNGAFGDCESLRDLYLPSTLKKFGGDLYYCSSLRALYCRAIVPPTGFDRGDTSFADEYYIYVPAESVDTYKAADGWKDLAEHIVAEE